MKWGKVILIGGIFTLSVPLFGTYDSELLNRDSMGRGYEDRACGFDTDDDGIVGEASDCNVCDGVTTDIDGDGQNEDLIYVCAAGSTCAGATGNDTTGDGSPSTPYATIEKAFLSMDGPSIGQEDIVCIGGTFNEYPTHEDPQPGKGTVGVDGWYTAETVATTNLPWDLLKPTNPAMIVGWDQDNDGCYPPYDDGSRDTGNCGVTGDVAVLDGSAFDAEVVRVTEANGFIVIRVMDFFEVAHFTIDNYFTSDLDTDLEMSYPGAFLSEIRVFDLNAADYVYIHDLEIIDWSKGSCKYSSFKVFATPQDVKQLVFQNSLVKNVGSYYWRGGTTGLGVATSFNNTNYQITFTGWPRDWQNWDGGLGGDCDGTDDYNTSGYNSWGDGSEYMAFIDMWVDGVSDDFTGDSDVVGYEYRNGMNGFGGKTCSSYIYVINGYYEDMNNVFGAYTTSKTCNNPGSLTDFKWFERNEIVWDQVGDTAKGASNAGGGQAWNLYSWDSSYLGNGIKDIFMYNNIAYTVGGGRMCAGTLTKDDSTIVGDYDTGSIEIIGNTFYTDNPFGTCASGGSCFWFGNAIPSGNYRYNNFVVYGNICDTPSSPTAGGFGYETRNDLTHTIGGDLTDPLIDYNIFTPGLYHEWDDVTNLSHAQWITNSTADGWSFAANDKLCNPVYVDEAGDGQSRNLRLADSDTCAKDITGYNPSGYFRANENVDWEDEARPQDTLYDIGGDEQSGVDPPPPSTTKCCSG